MNKNRFMFATGIENSYPNIILPNGKTKRIDEMEKTGHYKFWKEDFLLVKESGMEHLRYGPPYYKCHIGPGKYDWSFSDETFKELERLEIVPIVDLCHFGVPDWIGNFQNTDWPYYFAEYAEAFAKRYPHLQYYTPVNEIFITAMFSGQYGWWNECLTSDRTFLIALKNLCKANILAMQAIHKHRPDAIFIQSESSEYFHAENPDVRPLCDFLNQKRFLSLDFTYGYSLDADMYKYLLENGMTDEEYKWFGNHRLRTQCNCVMGNDYYITNEHMVHSNGSTSPAGEILGYYVITHQYFRRYKLPVMHTETNLIEPLAVHWLKKQWANVYRLKEDGVPVIGFTWYSLIDQVDWDSALRNDAGIVNSLGMYDLERKIRPLGKEYISLIKQWKDVISNESFGVPLY
ncbi:MAG: glycoside hydrolase family 1 protein [Segetibacter sp.]|jgi:beta-glucosidase/6-phospho-beta-glucosidase/beta-galactosidase|nr:glycoside hydrolase family 1 protein [Segetibacter sp.]